MLYRHLWPVRLYNIFSTLSHKRDDFLKQKIIEYRMCSDIMYDVCLERLLILRRLERGITINVPRSSFKYPLFCQILINPLALEMDI